MTRVHLPARFALHGKIAGNAIMQLDLPYQEGEANVTTYDKRGVQGHIIDDLGVNPILMVERKTASKAFDQILFSPTGIPISRAHLKGASWLRPKAIYPAGLNEGELEERCKDILSTWDKQFFFLEERCIGDDVIEPGLRPPQIGALYATLAHWKVTDEVATVVMPTGTGKTETMLAILVQHRPERLLVVVPTSALRDQTADKFLSLGLLKRFGIVGAQAALPVVGKLEHQLQSREEVETYFRCCNVIISTMSVIGGCPDEVQVEIARQCSHLFIDEAHHAPATTWDSFRQIFVAFEKPVLQFTATPFRRDGKHIGGKVIFNYPLLKAQQEGYFKPITFLSVWEYNPRRADESIACAAVEQLEHDLAEGYDHIVMARTESIDRATSIHKVYQRLAPKHRPLLIHSNQPKQDLATALEALKSRRSRIVICVSMLGEGFDLPELKIAALHDVHKSLAVTIQFTGRFTRKSSNSIGEATVVANGADAKVEEALEDLYAKDADWNVVLRRLSEGATSRQVQRSQFLYGFANPPAAVPLQNIYPKMSTVVYRTSCDDWNPERIRDVVKEDRFFAGPTINNAEKVMLYVTRDESSVAWGQSKELRDVTHGLYLFHWSEEQDLLYINSTDNRSLHGELAKAIAGDDVELIRGENMYRCLYGINRLILMNLGLLHLLSRATQFTMHVGSDIKSGLSRASLQNRRKSNLFGYGYENGNRVSMGGSHKGRVWSYRVAEDISEWVAWCRQVGAKLIDDSISTDAILEHVILPEVLPDRPLLVPLAIEWSEYFLARSEEAIRVEINEELAYFYEVGMEITNFGTEGPIRFRLFTDDQSIEYKLLFHENSIEYVPIGAIEAYVIASGRHEPLSAWFQKEPPVIRFETNGFLVYNEWYQSKHEDREPFDPDRIVAWDWSTVDLTKESKMKAQKSPPALILREDSIQHRVLTALCEPNHNPDYDIVFDDDDTNEVADIVAIKVAGDRLLVHLFHCKYSKSAAPGARVEDLYAVCGQAQRSVYWKSAVQGMFEHLKAREVRRWQKYALSRFERGDLARLEEVARRARFLEPDFKVYIVQPGLSRREVNSEQLDLLGATELYLKETYAVDLEIIASN